MCHVAHRCCNKCNIKYGGLDFRNVQVKRKLVRKSRISINLIWDKIAEKRKFKGNDFGSSFCEVREIENSVSTVQFILQLVSYRVLSSAGKLKSSHKSVHCVSLQTGMGFLLMKIKLSMLLNPQALTRCHS